MLCINNLMINKKKFFCYNIAVKKKKKEIFIGKIGIGGDNPVSIQSMTSTDTRDISATGSQIRKLYKQGCDIVSISIPDEQSALAFKELLKTSPIPIIADIHFKASLALKAIESGAHGIRINPGNIGSKKKLKEILHLAGERNTPIRIGVNWGSIKKPADFSHLTKPEIMVQTALDYIKFFEDNHFTQIKISLKSSNVADTVNAYRLIDKKCDYPLHLGITEAGTFLSGTIKSAMGIGSLLLDGIGDTIRVSLTDDPQKEVQVANEILKVAGLKQGGIDLISCPTCARTSVDLIKLVKTAERRLQKIKTKKKISIAIMGCEVNGPGEAKEADIGLAFSQNTCIIFKKGRIVKKIHPDRAIEILFSHLQELI